ncbi:hypothetical protein FGIG_07759 [Fasciola gigantica]|uniref:Uncharacterized protein n=1 Tax=Fasciola gigantica TaxID=46835 RepID=A0A504Z3Q2_FASGI|nr:hypothetical protein FGIG_07759 [Fasciola gigantica]
MSPGALSTTLTLIGPGLWWIPCDLSDLSSVARFGQEIYRLVATTTNTVVKTAIHQLCTNTFAITRAGLQQRNGKEQRKPTGRLHTARATARRAQPTNVSQPSSTRAHVRTRRPTPPTVSCHHAPSRRQRPPTPTANNTRARAGNQPQSLPRLTRPTPHRAAVIKTSASPLPGASLSFQRPRDPDTSTTLTHRGRYLSAPSQCGHAPAPQLIAAPRSPPVPRACAPISESHPGARQDSHSQQRRRSPTLKPRPPPRQTRNLT